MSISNPNITRTIRATLALIFALAIWIPSTASARPPLPHPGNAHIDVPKSIGGVGLGGSLKSAAQIWNVKDDCGSYVCALGNLYGQSGSAQIEAAQTGKKVVNHVDIYAAPDIKDLKHPLMSNALKRFKTKEGIGLGSTVSDLKKAYPEAKKFKGDTFLDYFVKGKHKSKMSFGIDNYDGHGFVTSVRLDSGK